MVKTQWQSLYASKPGKGGESWEKVKAEVVSAKVTSSINIAIEENDDAVEDGFGLLQGKSNDPCLHDQVEREQLDIDHLYLDRT